MKRIDAHQHFWKFDPLRDSWITEEMRIIKRDFFPKNLEPFLKKNEFDGCVVIQSEQSINENLFQLENAENSDIIKGIVGWAELQSPTLEDDLVRFSNHKKMKGFRHMLQSEPNRALMLEPAFTKGIKLLNKYQYTYDIVVYPDQLQYIPAFVAACPDQPFVLDHLGRPNIRKKHTLPWKEEISAIAQHKNVYCKISGMVTEAHLKTWKQEDFKSFLNTVVDAFGIDRLMFGSDWPMCLVAATYDEVVGIVADYFSTFTQDEQDKIFGLNAIKFYRLDA